MSKLTDEQIDNLYINGTKHWIGKREIARAVEAIVTEPLLQRIAELEQRNRDLYEDVQRFKKHALNEKAARMELERQLEEARKQMDAQKDEWLSWEAKRKALEKDAEGYRQLRDGSNWPAVFASHDAPEPLRGEELDAAMQKGQSMNIIELAEKAGLKVGTNISGVTLVGSPSTPGLAHISIDEMERFAALVLEEAAKVCDERAMKNERACDGLDDEDATSLRSAAWQMSVCAADIRALKGAKE